MWSCGILSQHRNASKAWVFSPPLRMHLTIVSDLETLRLNHWVFLIFYIRCNAAVFLHWLSCLSQYLGYPDPITLPFIERRDGGKKREKMRRESILWGFYNTKCMREREKDSGRVPSRECKREGSCKWSCSDRLSADQLICLCQMMYNKSHTTHSD